MSGSGQLSSWVDIAEDSGFPLENLPYGVFTLDAEEPRVGAAVGEYVLDLARAADAVGSPDRGLFATSSLNALMAAGPEVWSRARATIQSWLHGTTYEAAIRPSLIPRVEVRMLLPFEVGDYVDFYSSLYHATNLGRLFRPTQEPLTPNWRHLPIGYHGRSGTVAVSGTDVRRPCGQLKSAAEDAPTFGPSQRLDIEAEVGFVVGAPSRQGSPVAVADFARHVFGVCLVNDWSARDLQAWEYVPLGPFLGKSFLTSISPWIVPLDALRAARVPPPVRTPPVLDYLDDSGVNWGLDIQLEVRLNGQVISRPPFHDMYWTPAQQLAHMTVNGASIRTGDLYASGTVSGPAADQRGSLIELTWGGAEPLELASGQRRSFLEDGDEVVISATAPGINGTIVGLGEVQGRVTSS